MMRNHISNLHDVRGRHDDGPQPIGVVLAELLAQYESRFPEAHVAIVETPVTAAYPWLCGKTIVKTSLYVGTRNAHGGKQCS